jgi:hypothetical protein
MPVQYLSMKNQESAALERKTNGFKKSLNNSKTILKCILQFIVYSG